MKLLIEKNSKLLFGWLLSLIICNVSAQMLDKRTVDREREYQKIAENALYYIESYPDSLHYKNMRFLFCQSPLTLKPGYSNIFHDFEGIMLDIRSAFPTAPNGLRGYLLTWMVRNDSLFISKIHIKYFEVKERNPVAEDTINSRLEKFTGCQFKNGLLFVNWITGNLRVITKHNGGYPTRRTDQYGEFTDDRKYGSILTVKNGLIFDFKEDRTNNTSSGQNHIAQREFDYQKVKSMYNPEIHTSVWNEIVRFYVDAEPDTLYYDGSKFLFRQSPLSLKQGYTDVYHENEVSIFNMASTSLGGGIMGLKGYHLTWVTRNDSLFISDIYPTYYDPNNPTLCKDTIISRMQTFTKGRFINDLLFVDWISGDFGILTKHIRNIRDSLDEQVINVYEYTDDRKYGKLVTIRNGMIIGLEEDNRQVKN